MPLVSFLRIHYQIQGHEYLPLCFLLRVLALPIRYLVHFELILVYGVRLEYNFILLHVAIQLSQHHLLKTVLSPTEWTWYPCQKSIDYR